MDADLEASIEEGRRRMRQFEERLSHQIDLFDQEVDQKHSQHAHKFSYLTEDLKPVSMPLWGVILETPEGHRIYKDHVSMNMLSKYPRNFASSSSNFCREPEEPPSIGYYRPSPAAQAIIEGRKWGVNKYSQDDEYVSNAPYGIIMKRSPRPECVDNFDLDQPKGKIAKEQPNTQKVSSYWRRKWKVPDDW